MAGKVIEPEEIIVNQDITPIETEVVPEPALPTTEVRPDVAAKVESIIERASRSNAWTSAAELFRARLQGVELDYALAELAKAEQESVPVAQAA